MPTGTGLIAVDWGTTNRRAYAIGGGGEVTHRLRDGLGILSIKPGGFPAAVADLRVRLGQLPILMAGMVGSNRGWVEVPYVDCPAGLGKLARSLKHVPEFDAAIVPGLLHADGGHADVMRGEEVQILGAVAANLLPPDAAACHPGTHAKWVKVKAGEITAFRTIMTGELFALLKNHSLLASQLQAEVTPGHAFAAGVQRSLDRCELTADLFQIRARGLTGRLSDEDAAPYASGLLIGADIRAGLSFLDMDQPVALIGSPRLTTLYAAALRQAGRESREIDGQAAFLAGIRKLAEELR
jgi:2-dehydro-3-deoxygalactonokinase